MSQAQLRNLTHGDIGWLIQQHGEAYARDEGFDMSFEALVAEILADFLRNHDPECERGWLAYNGKERLGSIFCVREDDATAKLRLFYLTPEARGQGLGKRLLSECMGFAKDKGYRRMSLWTHESHRAACALYRSTGWRETRSQAKHSFGVDVVEQGFEIDL